MQNLQEKDKQVALAKPDGLTYEEHVGDVRQMVGLLKQMLLIQAAKYVRFFPQNALFDITDTAAIYHDEGKLHPAWQIPCQKDYAAFQEWKKQQSYEATAQDFERERRDIAGANIRTAGFRHEVGSLVMHGHKISGRERVAIAAHHGKLAIYHQGKWQTVNLGKMGAMYFDWLREKHESGDKTFSVRLIDFLKFSGPRAMLQIADRRASAMEGGNPHPPIIAFHYNFPKDWQKREVQKIAEANWEKELLVFRAPTGAGKTDASLLWAKKQIDNGKAQRLVIAMPTRFTSTAMAISTEDSISEVGLYHSSARFVERSSLAEKSKGQKEGYHLYAKWLMSPVTICTIDHLLMALTLTREDHHITLFNLANSCLVIDEADAYDDFMRQNIGTLLKACRKWQVPVMIMSASIADSELGFFQEIGYDISTLEEDVSEYQNDQCELKSTLDFETPNDIAEILNLCIRAERAIIYVNTVERAIVLFEWLQHRVGDIPLHLYHSRFLEKDKRVIEEKIITCLGKKAWEEKTARGIVILTQIGEMSINISAEIMLTELCPIDRLVQRVGRLCRFKENKTIGALYVLRPLKNGKFYPPPYGEFQRGKGWSPSLYLTRSEEILKERVYQRGSWIALINEVYAKRTEHDDRAIENSKNLQEIFSDNWLVRMTESTKEDDIGAVGWKARDMDVQRTILVKEPDEDGFFYFSSWSEYYYIQSEYGIALAVYLAEKGQKNGTILPMRLKINGEEQDEKVFMANPDRYSVQIGLDVRELDSIM